MEIFQTAFPCIPNGIKKLYSDMKTGNDKYIFKLLKCLED